MNANPRYRFIVYGPLGAKLEPAYVSPETYDSIYGARPAVLDLLRTLPLRRHLGVKPTFHQHWGQAWEPVVHYLAVDTEVDGRAPLATIVVAE